MHNCNQNLIGQIWYQFRKAMCDTTFNTILLLCIKKNYDNDWQYLRIKPKKLNLFF